MIAAGDFGVRNYISRQRRWQGLWTIVLAAGGARRFGRNKLLVRAGPESLLVRAARQAVALTGSRTIVVLGADSSLLATDLAGLPVRIVVNRRWREGMARSLQAGIGSLPVSARATLVTLADQYAISRHDLWRLASAWASNPRAAAAALVADGPGAPAVLPRSYFPRVMGLEGDRGARSLLLNPDMPVTMVELPAAAYDLDEPGDFRHFRCIRRRLP
jgi:molybdenum cofactor cytidylyltransferase